MAATLSAPISAAGRRVLALFRPFFTLVLETIRRVFRRLLHFVPSFPDNSSSSSSPTKTQGEQTEPLCPTTAPSAHPNPNVNSDNPVDLVDGPADREGENTAMPVVAPSPSPSTTVAPAVGRRPKKVPVPQIVPAIPILPGPRNRENAAPRQAASCPPSAAAVAPPPDSPHITTNVSQLTNEVASLHIEGALGGKAPPAPKQPHKALGRVDGQARDDETITSPTATINRPLSAGVLTDLDWNGGCREVVRAPAVPMHHEVSQTSKLKETAPTTIGDENERLQTRLETPEEAAERTMHSGFMREALDMARLALKTNETPVGCVLVYRNRVIARGMNATNISRNGTRHAELMAISALLSYSPASDLEPSRSNTPARRPAAHLPLGVRTNQSKPAAPAAYVETSTWGDVDPRDGHLFPYGQKLHPSPRVDQSIIRECILYVTVEPCVMCASLLRQLGIKKVFFGAVNDKFGGTGGVFRIHINSPYSMAAAPPLPSLQDGKGYVKPAAERPPSSNGTANGEACCENGTNAKAEGNGVASTDPPPPGDGGNVERGYDAEGGWGRDEAVTLLRQFYVQENGRAPVPRKKEGRAARLAMMMQRDGHAGGPMIDPSATESLQDSGSDTPMEASPTMEAASVLESTELPQ